MYDCEILHKLGCPPLEFGSLAWEQACPLVANLTLVVVGGGLVSQGFSCYLNYTERETKNTDSLNMAFVQVLFSWTSFLQPLREVGCLKFLGPQSPNSQLWEFLPLSYLRG